ncbi:MAG: hypothetical protein GF370_03365 [Candidatus Nealsonbacteria bacterium]|nr:hypothetical protein [Candidatus Nealsonbacteria bacterium]
MGLNFVSEEKEIKKLLKNDNFVFFLGMLLPRRPGIVPFGVKLEYFYFPPSTEKNRDFLYGLSIIAGVHFAVIGIPKKKMNLARKIAKECGLKIVEGIPCIVSKNKVDSFLMNRGNIYSLENCSDHEVYRNNPREIRRMIKKEDKEVEKIFRNPEKYIKEEPKPVKVDWE